MLYNVVYIFTKYYRTALHEATRINSNEISFMKLYLHKFSILHHLKMIKISSRDLGIYCMENISRFYISQENV